MNGGWEVKVRRAMRMMLADALAVLAFGLVLVFIYVVGGQ